MKPISSALENREYEFDTIHEYLQQNQFTLGGNWDYDHGYFDRHLDEGHKVWIRIPFTVAKGTFAGAETPNPDVAVRMGSPFVLKHLYNEGLDAEAVPRTYGALLDQFQDPVDKDAQVEESWVKQASAIMQKVDEGLPG